MCVGGSSVGIATELLAGRFRIEYRWGRDFPPVQTGPGAHPTACKIETDIYVGPMVNGNNKLEEEIRERIAKGNKAFYANKTLCNSKLVSRKSKLKLYWFNNKTNCDIRLRNMGPQEKYYSKTLRV